MPKSLTLPSPAKLNLFLHINGRREDGYHQLQTLFQLLDRGDQLRFTPRDDNTLTLTPEIPGVAFEDNLIIRAARLLQKKLQNRLQNQNQEKLQITSEKDLKGVDIELVKNLPMGGGIGGGSSNAATTLLALNKIWDSPLSIDELAELGRQLGADVPVFVRGHSAFAEGIGEKLTPLELPELWFSVITPNCHVSTAEVFCHPELTRDTPIIKLAPSIDLGRKNDCQHLVRNTYPEVDQALKWLDQYAPASMTGTGASVFASFNSEAEAEAVIAKMPEQYSGFAAKGVNISPLHKALN